MGWLLYLILQHGSVPVGNEPATSHKVARMQEALVIGKPQQKSKWSMTPSVRVCASSEVTASRVGRAMRYWESRGYDFTGLSVDPNPTCMEARYGEILITLPDGGFSDQHMASTKIYTHNKTGEIVKSKIYILPMNARKDRVLEHEIGHALGWSHYPQRYHIMHPVWKDGGYDSRGVHKR